MTKELKLSYSVYSEKWQWMLGTGVYLDDVYAQLDNLQQEINTHLNNTKADHSNCCAYPPFSLFFCLALPCEPQPQKTS